MLHEQSEPKQVVDFFLNDAVLHRLGDLLSRLVREPLVGTPGVDGSDLVVALLRLCNDVVAEHLLQHLLGFEVELSIEPERLWQNGR